MKKVFHIFLSLFLAFIFAFGLQNELVDDPCLYFSLNEFDETGADEDSIDDIQINHGLCKIDGGNGNDEEDYIQDIPIPPSVFIAFSESFPEKDVWNLLTPAFCASSRLPTTFSRPGFFILYHSFKADIA